MVYNEYWKLDLVCTKIAIEIGFSNSLETCGGS